MLPCFDLLGKLTSTIEGAIFLVKTTWGASISGTNETSSAFPVSLHREGDEARERKENQSIMRKK